MRILIVDDHGIVREGLRSLIGREPDMEVVGEAEDGVTAVRLARELAPDMVIMDVTMPRLSGIETTRQILSTAPATKVIALSMHAEGHIVKEMLDAGVCGYILKTNLFDELSRALHTAASGGCYLSQRITDLVVHDWLQRRAQPVENPQTGLSPREREILQLTAEGKTVKDIARHLHVSIKTIHANRRRLMEKLGVSTVAELTKCAISRGITSVEF